MQDIPHDGIIPFSYDNVKTCFQNSDCIREKLLRRIELFEFAYLNLKGCAFKILIVLLLCYNIIYIYIYIYIYL